MAIQRGEIYWVDWSPARGSEQAGIRPALIVQNEVGNRASSTTIVAAVTSSFDRLYPFMVRLDPGETGLTAPSVVNLSQLLTIAQERLLARSGGTAPRLIGQVGSPQMAEVDRALRISLGL